MKKLTLSLCAAMALASGKYASANCQVNVTASYAGHQATLIFVNGTQADANGVVENPQFEVSFPSLASCLGTYMSNDPLRSVSAYYVALQAAQYAAEGDWPANWYQGQPDRTVTLSGTVNYNGAIYTISGNSVERYYNADPDACGGSPLLPNYSCGYYSQWDFLSPGIAITAGAPAPALSPYQILDIDCAADIQRTACPPAGGGLTGCLNQPAHYASVSNACRAGLANFFINVQGTSVAGLSGSYPNLFPAATDALWGSALLAVDVACMPDLIRVPAVPLAGQGITGWLNAYDPSVSQSCIAGLAKYWNMTPAQLQATYHNL